MRADVTSEETSCAGDWRWQFRNRVEGADALASLLHRHGQVFDRTGLEKVVKRYRFLSVPYYLALIDWRDPHDPIRRQCIPDPRELEMDPAGVDDPFNEQTDPGVSGVVHRFPDRVLIMTKTECAMACRHCTRKNTLERSAIPPGTRDFKPALDYISRHPEVREVLLSGGEPLLLETAALDSLLASVLQIPHVEAVRIGSRAPVVLPMRIDNELVTVLRRHRPLWFNTQFNHPRELTPAAIEACARLVDAGIPVSNQTVLLKGVNDRADTMRMLCTGLQRHRVRPYYVFLCDPVAGIRHLRVDRETAKAIQEELRGSVGGLCLPRFVEDVPGTAGKMPL